MLNYGSLLNLLNLLDGKGRASAMEEYAYSLKNFTWNGELRLEDICLIHNGLSCTSESFEEAELSVNLFLDLISLAREKDVFFQSAHHPYVAQANRLRTYTTKYVQERPCSPEGMKQFLMDAYPLYRKASFREHTGAPWALRYYLAALGIQFFQAKYLCLFHALEILLAHTAPLSAEGPMAGLIQAVRGLTSIPAHTREVAADRLASPHIAERMVEFVRATGLRGVAFQAGGLEEVRYRFDELLRIREEFVHKGSTTRFVQGEGERSLNTYLGQLKALVRESLMILLNHGKEIPGLKSL